jgi:hypothetical protein
MSDLGAQVSDAAAVSVDKQKGLSGPVYLVVEAHTVMRKSVTGCLVCAVADVSGRSSGRHVGSLLSYSEVWRGQREDEKDYRSFHHSTLSPDQGLFSEFVGSEMLTSESPITGVRFKVASCGGIRSLRSSADRFFGCRFTAKISVSRT